MTRQFFKATTLNDLKSEYKQLAKSLHPDMNPDTDTTELFKSMQAEYELLVDTITDNAEEQTSAKKFSDDVAAIIILDGLDIEVCGSWVWVSGDTKKHKESLKENGFRWSRTKKMWYWRPATQKKFYRSKPRSMEYIRGTYGSTKVNDQKQKQVA